MKDIHSHILFSIDDGSSSIDESISILKKAIDNNYTDIILTPHYRKRQGYVATNKIKLNKFKKLKKEIERLKLNINIYLGNEVTVDEDLFYYLKTDQVLTLNNSRYILLELPFYERINYLNYIFDELIENNYIPIIPHPERYNGYNEKDYIKWVKKGILFQGNIESLYGKYGDIAKKKLENLLKHHLIHFMGSDVHSIDSKVYELDYKNKLEKFVKDSNIVNDITNNNINKVIRNELVEPYEIKIKKIKIFN